MLMLTALLQLELTPSHRGEALLVRLQLRTVRLPMPRAIRRPHIRVGVELVAAEIQLLHELHALEHQQHPKHFWQRHILPVAPRAKHSCA